MNESQYFETIIYSPVGIRTMNAIGIAHVKEVWQRADDSKFKAELSLDGKVTFGCGDYDYFVELAASERRYDDVRAVVSSRCSGALSVKWRAFIDIRKGIFDHDKKTFACSLSIENSNRDFESKKSTVFNLFQITSTRATTSSQYLAGLIFKNGIPLYSAFLAMFRAVLTVGSITSDFFQWNSSSPSYTIGHSAKLQNQALFQKSDIVRASISGYSPATIMNITLIELIENLCAFYNMQWSLDAAGNFRIEHVSWYSHASGIDLTDTQYQKSIIGTREFSYDEPKIFRVEKFTNEQSVNLDFVGVPIEYENALILNMKGSAGHLDSTVKDEDTLERKASFITDIDGLYGDIGKSTQLTPDDSQDLDGILLLAMTGYAGGNIEKVNGILETDPVQRNNNVNSWAILQDDYWKDGRLFDEGKMNKITQAFTNVQRIKIRKTIIIPLCCDESFDADASVTTEEGIAIIKKATRDTYRGTLSLDLIYEDSGSIVINAPNAVNDIYAADLNTDLDTATAGKPSLIANDTDTTSALVESKSTLLGGTVDIFSDGHFVYSPPTGVIGLDLFDYIAQGAAGRIDVGQAKVIVKIPGVYVHMAIYSYYTLGFVGTVMVGWVWHYVIKLEYYEDSFLQVPLNLTGRGISIPWLYDIYYTPSNTPPPVASDSGTQLASGFFNEIANSLYTTLGSGTSAPSMVGVITPSSDYTIV